MTEAAYPIRAVALAAPVLAVPLLHHSIGAALHCVTTSLNYDRRRSPLSSELFCKADLIPSYASCKRGGQTSCVLVHAFNAF